MVENSIEPSKKEVFYTEGDTNFSANMYRDLTVKKSYLDVDSMMAPWNPDDLVQKRQDFSLYEQMLKDDQVSVCLQLKKDLILCSGFDFITSDDGHKDIVEDLKIAICDDPEWSFEEMLEEILSSCEFGFSITEKIFKKRPTDGKLSLRCLKTRHPGPWMFHTDDFGNIVRYEQQGNLGNKDIPPEVLIHFYNKRKFQNPYGVSDLRPAYEAYFTKKHICRWYSIFIEKAGSPVPIGKYHTSATEQARIDMFNTLKRFQTKTAMVIPKEFEVDFLEAKSSGEVFIKGINLFNMFIGRSLLIPDLLGFQGSETSGGSYSLGKSQMEVFYKHIMRRRTVLERVINNEIIWPIVLHNWGYVDNYPKFKLRPITQEEIIESTKLWLEAVKGKVYSPAPEEIDHFKAIINYPITDQEIEDVEGDGPDVNEYPTQDGDQTTLEEPETVPA